MSTPIEMRKYLAYMRKGNPIILAKEKVEETKKDMTMRDMLGKMRNIKDRPLQNLNEDDSVLVSSKDTDQQNMSTGIDRKAEEDKMTNYFNENNVTIEYNELKIYSNGVYFSGTIDNQIQFVYKVAKDEKNSGVEVEFLPDFDEHDPENDEVVKNIENYYDIFYKYWRSNLFY